MATTPFFDLLFDVPDIPPLIFFWLDPSSLALAACVCQKWRNLAQLCRGSGKAKFRLVLADLVADAPLLAWAAANLGKKQLPSALQTRVCTLAALKGALATLQWLREGGCEWDGLTCAFAAKGGHLVVLQWLRANGCEWDGFTCAFAAEGGHLSPLQWARDNGCEWDERTCACAAEGGHLAVLKWARENGCEWDRRTCAFAALGGHLAILQWAREKSCP